VIVVWWKKLGLWAVLGCLPNKMDAKLTVPGGSRKRRVVKAHWWVLLGFEGVPAAACFGCVGVVDLKPFTHHGLNVIHFGPV